MTGDRAAPGDRSTEIDRLLFEYIDRLNAGEILDPSAIERDHPEIAVSLIERLQVYRGLEQPPAASMPAGTIGDYTLRRQIGRGGMGVVYEAWQNSLERQVALKVLPPGMAADAKSSSRFLREAQIAAKLSHPQIVSVFATGIEGGTPYYAMEYVEGETLAQVLVRVKEAKPEEETPFGPKDQVDFFAKLARCFADVADGLQHAHSKGIIHRDIKPSNLILDREGRLRILDFGLARLEGQESLTLTGDFLGTPLYMSPEQARRKKIAVDHRTDVYSLGATLYEMLTSQPPFRGKDHQDTLSQIIERDATKPRSFNPRVPKDLETIVLKCLRKEAGDRYGTAEACEQDLRRFVRGGVIEAREERLWDWTMRRAWGLRRGIGVGLLVLIASTVIVVELLNWRREYQATIEREYASLVRNAALRLEQASIVHRGGAGEAAFWDPLEDADFVGSGKINPAIVALEELENAAALLPRRPDAIYHRARALLYLGRADKAREMLAALGDCDRPFLPALTLASALLDQRGERAAVSAAIESARQAAVQPWEKAWLDRDQALKAKDSRRDIDAESVLIREFSRQEPFLGGLLGAYLGRGWAWSETKEYGLALQDFTIAEHLAPGALEPMLCSAMALHHLGQKQTAEHLLEQAFEATDRKDEVAGSIANVYEGLGEKELTLLWIDRIKDDFLRATQRAWKLKNQSRSQEAKESARLAIQLGPKRAGGYLALASLYLNYEMRPDLAILACREALLYQPDSWAVQHLLGTSLNAAGRYAEAIPYLEEGARLAVNPGRTLATLAGTYWQLADEEKAQEWARRAREVDPWNSTVNYNLSSSLLTVGKLDEAFDIVSYAPATFASRMGAVRFLQRRGVEAIELFELAVRNPGPQFRWNCFMKAVCEEHRGRAASALGDFAKHFEEFPNESEVHGYLTFLLRESPAPIPEETLERLVEKLEKARVLEPRSSRILSTLSLALSLLPGEERRTQAIQAALDGLDWGEASDEFVGELRLTLRSLITTRTHAGSCLLDGLPRVPAYAGTDALFENREADLSAGCEDSSKLPSAAADDPAASRRSRYLRASVLNARGLMREAEPLLRELAAEEKERPEPLLLLAEVLCEQGNAESAEAALRDALAAAPDRHWRLWNAWLDVSFRMLGRSPAQILALFPTAPPEEPHAASEGFLAVIDRAEAQFKEVRYAEDIRWLLEELAAGRSLRIRCGGESITLTNGQVWGRDRFFRGGKKRFGGEVNIQGTHQDEIYWRARNFYKGHLAEERRCVIPVPPGRYRVHLHFAEIEGNWPGLRNFGVSIEGEEVLKNFEILAEVPFRAAIEKVFEATVERGPLEIRFERGPHNNGALISAIEVERVE